jgi:tRNA dimethylallyltransferase
MKRQDLSKIIVLLGPTASGKSDVAIKLAKKFNGEIISADSRQIYRHANLTTGKITSTEQKMTKHWMIDILNINSTFSAEQFKKKAQKIIEDILKRRKLPIICGGTGFWIKALVDNVDFPQVRPDWKLRKQLDKFNTKKLFSMLKKIDARRARDIDSKNKVRLIRALEICKKLGKVPQIKSLNNKYEFIQIGISIPREKLNTRIQLRLRKRLQQGMIREVEILHKKYGASWKRLDSLGLEFRWIAQFLQHKITRKEMEDKLFQEIKNYAKRQMTWFKKEPKIKWLKKYPEIETTINKFLKKY